MHAKKTVESIEFRDKKVIVRVDFNVPLENNQISDDLRIKSSLPTIRYLINNGAAVILISHLGRPNGKIVENLRLKPVFDYLKKSLKTPVFYTSDCIGTEVIKSVSSLKTGQILLLENLRFHPEEKKNDPVFAKQLADLADIYVNDAFGTAHRAHASTVGIAQHLPAVAGFLMKNEIEYIGNAVENPIRPFTAIIGGKKVSDKIVVLKRLIEKCDNILIGGGMAYTFLKAQGKEIGDSIVDEQGINISKEILTQGKSFGKTILLPEDIVIANMFSNNATIKTVPSDQISVGWQGLDIGPKTIEIFGETIKKSQTIIWNGPVGVFEMEKFANGTRKLAQLLAESKVKSIIGGGDTAAAVQQFGYADKMTHISTGGGASLELLEGKILPGLAALNDAD